MRTFQLLIADERGQDMIEYALLVGFVVLAVSTAAAFVAVNVSTIFSKVNSTTQRAAGS